MDASVIDPPKSAFANRYAGTMPTAKALEIEVLSSNPWWRTLAKWRNLTRKTSSDQELTSNG
jgi:hypothetical protein